MRIGLAEHRTFEAELRAFVSQPRCLQPALRGKLVASWLRQGRVRPKSLAWLPEGSNR